MFFETQSFEFINELKKNWASIRQEYEGLDSRIVDIHRNASHQEYLEQIAKNNGWTPSWQVGSIEKNYNWLTYGLYYRGACPDEAAEKFPLTMALLKSMPCVVSGAFSKMKLASMIASHRHPELGGNLLTCHIGIDLMPQRSYLCVDGKFEEELEGKAIVFDGSCEHFAVNASDSDRTILYIEFDKSKI